MKEQQKNAHMKMTLIDVTPAKHRCAGVATGCPAVLKSGKHTYIIIGKLVDANLQAALRERIGDDETAIEISAELIEEAISSSLE